MRGPVCAYCVFLLVLVLVTSCGGPGDGSQDGMPVATAATAGVAACARLPARAPDSILQIDEYDDYPCRIVVAPTGIALRASPEAAYPDPEDELLQVARDGRGRFYTPARRDRVVIVWNPDGTYLTSFGRSGQGPGEFAGGWLAIHVGAGDTLHVRDGAGRWLAFDPDYRFVRMSRDSMRALASSGDVWVAPARGSGLGYVLERRNAAGELVQVLRRDVPWLPLGGYADVPGLPEFESLHTDAEGLLWIVLVVRDARWSPLEPGEQPDARDDERFDIRLEVIDPAAGAVLASVRFDEFSGDSLLPVIPVRHASRLTVGVRHDSLGLASLPLYELLLLDAGGGGAP